MSKLIHMLTALAACISLSLQAASPVSSLSPELFAAQVVHLDEFFTRFNGTDLPEHIRHIPDTHQQRVASICQLFDLEKIQGPDDPAAIPILQMAHDVIAAGDTLGYTDPRWYARAVCNASVGGHATEITLKLRPAETMPGAWVWTICDAEGDALTIRRPDNAREIYLDPSGHEANFMELRRITAENPRQIAAYLAAGVDIEPLDVFATLVYYGQLQLKGVNRLVFVFNDVAGYTFTVSEYHRNSSNSGWLISSFSKKQ